MEGFKFPKKIESKDVSKIKEGVDFVFEQHSDLVNLGTKEQYSEYLDTIFPESKVKEILFHNTSAVFDKFDPQFISRGNVSFGEGFYFTDNIKNHKGFKGSDKIIAVVVNANSIFNDSYKQKKQREEPKYNLYVNSHERLLEVQKKHNEFLETNFDAVIAIYNDKKEFVIFNPDQIHILGSQSDIEGFKKFIAHQQKKEDN